MDEIKVEKHYWVWKKTIIDFEELPNAYVEGQYYTKADYIFHYLPLPDTMLHKWYNGGYSSEYNEALRYAEELDLIKWIKEEELEND